MTSGTRLLIVALLAMTSPAFADDEADAKTLFKEGRKLLEAEDFEKACTKFEESEQLVPRDVTQLNLGDCLEKLGKTASAWKMFVKLAGSAKDDEFAEEGRKRAKALEAKLVRLTIEVEEEVDGLVIERGDQVIDRASWNQAVPVDPDEYTITAKADGYEEWSKTVRIKSKDKTVEVPKLRATKPTTQRVAVSGPNRYRGAALGLLIGGGGALVVATGLGFNSRRLENESDQLCPRPQCGNQRGVDLNRAARIQGWIANVGWGLGGAAVIAAVVTWRLGKSAVVAPAIEDDRVGVEIGGRF